MQKMIIYSQSVSTLLEKGRGKHRNVMLHGHVIGSTNCAKTFLPNPLNMLYRLPSINQAGHKRLGELRI